MSWFPKRDKLDPKQASAIDFAVAQDGNFYISGKSVSGKSVVLAHVAAELALSVVSTEAQLAKQVATVVTLCASLNDGII